MEYTEEFLMKVIQVGTLGYPFSKIVNVLDVEDEGQFERDFYDENHVVCKNYKKGLDKADFIIDNKLFDMAKKGDLDALKEYQARKKKSQVKFEEEQEQTRR
jgi:hypothetical protein